MQAAHVGKKFHIYVNTWTVCIHPNAVPAHTAAFDLLFTGDFMNAERLKIQRFKASSGGARL